MRYAALMTNEKRLRTVKEMELATFPLIMDAIESFKDSPYEMMYVFKKNNGNYYCHAAYEIVCCNNSKYAHDVTFLYRKGVGYPIDFAERREY